MRRTNDGRNRRRAPKVGNRVQRLCRLDPATAAQGDALARARGVSFSMMMHILIHNAYQAAGSSVLPAAEDEEE